MINNDKLRIIKGVIEIDEFLTKAELSKLLKVSPTTVDRWRKEGLPAIKVNRKVLFDAMAVETWIKDRGKK